MGKIQRGNGITFQVRPSTLRVSKPFGTKTLAYAQGTAQKIYPDNPVIEMGQAPVIPRHIRNTLPLLPSGPGGVHEFVIARSPEPDIQNLKFQI
jgi:hypothetical protein